VTLIRFQILLQYLILHLAPRKIETRRMTHLELI
jgi:hypothetical protein